LEESSWVSVLEETIQCPPSSPPSKAHFLVQSDTAYERASALWTRLIISGLHPHDGEDV
jgi:hypothetical protein